MKNALTCVLVTHQMPFVLLEAIDSIVNVHLDILETHTAEVALKVRIAYS